VKYLKIPRSSSFTVTRSYFWWNSGEAQISRSDF